MAGDFFAIEGSKFTGKAPCNSFIEKTTKIRGLSSDLAAGFRDDEIRADAGII
jgi:hypothetical protein